MVCKWLNWDPNLKLSCQEVVDGCCRRAGQRAWDASVLTSSSGSRCRGWRDPSGHFNGYLPWKGRSPRQNLSLEGSVFKGFPFTHPHCFSFTLVGFDLLFRVFTAVPSDSEPLVSLSEAVFYKEFIKFDMFESLILFVQVLEKPLTFKK